MEESLKSLMIVYNIIKKSSESSSMLNLLKVNLTAVDIRNIRRPVANIIIDIIFIGYLFNYYS